MLSGIGESDAVSNFLYYKPVLTRQSSDPNLAKELQEHIKEFTVEVSPLDDEGAGAEDVD